MIQIDSPVFISGHTRSGTNLLLRMIDGAPELMVPPGEGKINVLRRFSHLGAYENVQENIELNLEPDALADALSKTPLSKNVPGFDRGIFELVNALFN